MQGTPFIYQGEELGMSNARFSTISDYVDVETINAYQDLVIDRAFLSEESFLKSASIFGRDNVRTPMQWDASLNAGFSSGKPWLPLCKNYKEVNADKQIDDKDSVYNFYRSLIQLRKDSEYSDLIQNGRFTLLEPKDEHLFVYERQDDHKRILIVANYGNQKTNYKIPGRIIKKIISNTSSPIHQDLELLPYEAYAFELE
jgi:glycosidase